MAQYSIFDIGGCGCAQCNQTFNVQCGCTTALYTYGTLTISVYDSTGTTLLTSGTTATGIKTLSWAGSCNVVVKITGQSGAFAAFSQSLSLTSGGTTTLAFSPGTGRVCFGTCCEPIQATVTYVGNTGGPAFTCNLVYSGGNWTGTCTNAAGLTWTFVMSPAGSGSLVATCHGAPCGALNGIPCNATVTSVGCPEHGVFSMSGTWPIGGCANQLGILSWSVS